MRILMILPIYPIPTDSGSKRRMLAFVQGLSKCHQVVVASLGDIECTDLFEDNEQSWKNHIVPHKYRKYYPIMRSFLSTKTYREIKLYNDKFKELISRLLDNNYFDVIWVNFLNMVVYLEEYLYKWSKAPHSRPLLLLDQHNVDEHYWKSFLIDSKNLLYKIFCCWEVIKNKKLQNFYFPYFDIILSVSELDKEITEQYNALSGEVFLAPNGVDIKYFKPISEPKKASNPTIVFGGSLDVVMNQDAVQWFIKEVLPIVKKHIYNVKFLVAGRNPTGLILKKLKKTNPADIMIIANPLDIRDVYSQADVFVVPLRLGGGTKLKTLEAMAMALPVVSTSVGAQGLNVISGEHLYIADKPDTFASGILEFLWDRDKAKKIGSNARKFVENHFSWETIIRNVENKLISKLIKRYNPQLFKKRHAEMYEA